jgi:processive 1,2-diacylglycerol beta-glucosyltransferase
MGSRDKQLRISWRIVMIELYNEATGALIGEITEDELRFLVGELEEESLEDVDYYLSAATVDMLEADGADPALIGLLRQALDDHGEVDILWKRK